MTSIYSCLIYSILVNFLFVNIISSAWAGPNSNSGCALDLNYLTRNYEDKDIDQQIETTVQAFDNEEIIIAACALNVIDLDTWQADILFDVDRLKFIKAYDTFDNISNFLNKNNGSAIWMPAIETSKGRITIAGTLKGTDTNQAPDGSGIIAFLKFEIKNILEDIPVTLLNVNFLDSKRNHDIITNTQNAVISSGDTISSNIETMPEDQNNISIQTNDTNAPEVEDIPVAVVQTPMPVSNTQKDKEQDKQVPDNTVTKPDEETKENSTNSSLPGTQNATTQASDSQNKPESFVTEPSMQEKKLPDNSSENSSGCFINSTKNYFERN